jgi:hypothetical protein
MKKMVWIKNPRMETWACSECAWTFSPSGPPQGGTLEEMKQNYERQRDQEFTSHLCARYPRAASARGDSGLSRPNSDQNRGKNPGDLGKRNEMRRAS